MRRPITLNKPERQQGYALFIVLMMMVVIALLVVTATQSYNTEQRISTNDADRKLATTLAEAALREGENQIFDIEGKKTTFTKDCKNGLCSTPEVIYDGNFEKPENDKPEGDAWNRILPECIEKDEKDEKKKKKPQKCIDVNGKKYSLGENSSIKKSPRYIIEYLGTNSADKRTIYRVTAKAWGKNANTQVVLQSYVASE